MKANEITQAIDEAVGINFEKKKNSQGVTCDYLDGKKITPKDVLDAKQEFNQAVEELTGAIEKISAYGTRGQQLNAWKLAINSINELLPNYEKLFGETVGEV